VWSGRSDLARMAMNPNRDLLFATERLGEKEIITLRGMVRRATADPEIQCTVINGTFCEGLLSV
jgi:hypothetical protein